MEEIEFSVENHLKKLRRDMELSQEDLACALGISRQSVIALERGRYLPSLPLAVALCKFFNMAFEEVFNFDEDKERKEFDAIKVKVIKGADKLEPGKENKMIGDMEPWRPSREVISLRDAVDRLLSDSFITPRTVAGAVPKVDIKERKEDILVRAELPGIAEEDVDVEVSSDGVVTISGEKKEEKEEKEEGYYYRESHSGSFSRSFSLPSDVIADKARADIENGVLTITVPKAKPEKVQKLKVTAKKKDK